MKLLHLYHDIMNLYGEYGNMRILTRMLEKNKIDYELDCLSVGDAVQVADYDFIYAGSGTERNQKYVLPHLQTLKEELSQYIEAGKILLMTGNSFELLGSSITDAQGKNWQGLGLFPFTVKEQNRTRTTADAVFTMEGMEHPLVGFINKCGTIEGIDLPLFQVKMGLGNEGRGGVEGIRFKNFFGTHLTGPLLIKNPYFLDYLTTILCKNNALDHSWMEEEKAAYEVTLGKLGERLAQS
ncbi:MAG: hypothetical protein IJP31_09365 [Lachnospiraceae bacterium]|nr:hypothetical protein [Lachnospiraceae bacterium]